jgi:plastocyanin
VRRAIPFAILAACLGVGVLPALAADRTVGIRDYAFSPSRVAVMPGESVSWQAEPGYAGALHNVHFDGDADPLGPASQTFSATRQFDTEGAFTYHCDIHPSLMHGTVYVNPTGTVPPAPTASPTPTPSTSPSPSPTASPSPGGDPSPGPTTTGGSGATVTSFRARAAHSRFCTSRSAACKQPGVFLLIKLRASQPVRVRGTLRRGSRRVRAVSLRVRPGRRRVRLPGPRLRPGSYALTLRAGAITRRVRFAVRPS